MKVIPDLKDTLRRSIKGHLWRNHPHARRRKGAPVKDIQTNQLQEISHRNDTLDFDEHRRVWKSLYHAGCSCRKRRRTKCDGIKLVHLFDIGLSRQKHVCFAYVAKIGAGLRTYPLKIGNNCKELRFKSFSKNSCVVEAGYSRHKQEIAGPNRKRQRWRLQACRRQIMFD